MYNDDDTMAAEQVEGEPRAEEGDVERKGSAR